jgi:hypothetical protein
MDPQLLQSPSEIEAASALARVRVGRVVTEIARRSRPAAIVAAVSDAAKERVSNAMPDFAREAGRQVGKNALFAIGGVVGAVSAYRMGQHSTDASARQAPSEATGETAPSIATSSQPVDARVTSSAPFNASNVLETATKLAKAGATSAISLYLGHVLSKLIAPTSIETSLVDRHGVKFRQWMNDFVATNKAPLRKRLINGSGIPGALGLGIAVLAAIASQSAATRETRDA